MWGIFDDTGRPVFAALTFKSQAAADSYLEANLPYWTRMESGKGDLFYVNPQGSKTYIIKPIVFIEATEE